LSRKNLFFESLQWGRMFLAEIDLYIYDNIELYHLDCYFE